MEEIEIKIMNIFLYFSYTIILSLLSFFAGYYIGKSQAFNEVDTIIKKQDEEVEKIFEDFNNIS